MTIGSQALFGPLAAGLLCLGVIGLPLMIQGYSPTSQTVSEIGEVGSPARIPFTLLLCTVSACIAVFSVGLHRFARRLGRSPAPAYLAGCLAISGIGVGVFAFPHPLHNLFGESEIVGYQAPLALALSWRRLPLARPMVTFSWIMAGVVWIALGVNLLPIFRPADIWPHIKPVFGLVQRSLFVSWFAWCAGTGFLLYRAVSHRH
jgi:hypothetical protein